MKRSSIQITEKHIALMVVVISTVLTLASGAVAFLAYTAIGSSGLLAYAGLLVAGAIAVLSIGAIIQYSVELTKQPI